MRSARKENKTKKYYLILFVLFYLTYAYFFQGGGWNQNVRICLTRSIIHHGSFTIDYFKEDTKEMEFINAGDWAYYNGHYYCNKSPGLSFMAVPAFALSEYILQFIIPDDPERQILFSAYLSTLCTTVLFSALLGILIFHFFHHFINTSITDAFLLSIFFGFGTLAFSYSTTFYCHQPAACFSFCSFLLALYLRHGNVKKKELLALSSGFFASLAVFIEPSAILILTALFIYMLSLRQMRTWSSLFIAGCVPVGILQGFYNTVCFGSPFASSYNYANDLVMWKVNGHLFGIPSLKTFAHLLILPYRGLFVSSPVLLMAVPGIISFLKNKKWRAEAMLCIGISSAFLTFIASFYAWHGGSAPGPRYLLPAYPFFFLPAGFALLKFPKTMKMVGILSLTINLCITLVGNEIPVDVKNPLVDVVFTNIIKGNVSINPVPFSNFKDYNINDLAKIQNWKPNGNAFNLGELIWPNQLKSVLPLLFFWALWWFWWKRFVHT